MAGVPPGLAVGIAEELVLASGVHRIISGGQTGVDQGALDAALQLGIAHGGWCPRGRRCEAGLIPPRFTLHETESSDYRERTERNVLESTATLILYRGQIGGGTGLTIQFARQHRRPFQIVNLAKGGEPAEIMRWLREHQVTTLNVAGSRESSQPGIQQESMAFLISVFRPSV